MAVLDHTVPSTSPTSFLARVGAAIVRWAEAVAESRSRAGALAYYQSLSDEELAQKGLSRENIPQYVFRDLYC